ncbi:MAG: protein kinase [candidate division Zixibacteria bacterium]|nr:protein kinase [candidate division Zixibacteria bacterium]
MNKYSPYILYLVLALFVVVLAVNDFGPLSNLQQSIDDSLCSSTAPEGIRPNVVIVDIDGSSLDEYGQWPWDHDLIGDLTAAVASGNPKAILLDIDLYENASQEAAGHTKVLADQLTWIKQAVLSYDVAETTYRTGKTRNPEFLFINSIVVDNPLGVMDENSSLLVRKVFLPANQLLIHKPLLGFDYNRPDADRQLRHQQLVMNYDGYYYPATSLLTAATFLGVPPDQIKVIEGHGVQIGTTRIVPLDQRGDLLVRFSEGIPFTRFSAAQILSKDFDRSVLLNKAVVIGQLNGEDTEFYHTPAQEDISELVVKATVIENIINDNIITARSDLAKYSLIILLLFGGACAFVLPRVNIMYRMVILGGGLVVLANVVYMMFSSYGLLIPSVYVALELVFFMMASPMLDSKLLRNTDEENKKPGIKAPEIITEKDLKDTPVREIRSSAADPENVETTALNTDSGNIAPSAEIDHQTISLDEEATKPKSEIKSEAPDITEADKTSVLSESDASAMQSSPPDDSPSDTHSHLTDSVGNPIDLSELKNLGRYQVSGILGKGAMGTVYRGIDPAINRPVALKTIRLDFVTDPEEMAELKERLHREAQAAGKLSHPNIVTIYDVGSEGSLQYIAMEFLEGQTLEDMIKKKTRFNYRIIAQMISQVCAALEYAHERGIVHRDIKPANIMVLGDYRIKVMDFGIARVDSNSMTKTGIAMGTPNYISPEQLKGAEIDRRADIFSLGVMMYEMLLGKRPFKGENITSLMYAVLNSDPEKPSSVRPQVPLLFDHIIGKALKKDPAERYQKASEVTADLQDFVESFAKG